MGLLFGATGEPTPGWTLPGIQGVREWNCVLHHRRPELGRRRDSNEDFTYRASIMNADLGNDNWEIALDRVVFMGYTANPVASARLP